MTYFPTGEDEMSLLSEDMKKMNVETQLAIDEDVWPPNKPKRFIPLLVIQHPGELTLKLTQ